MELYVACKVCGERSSTNTYCSKCGAELPLVVETTQSARETDLAPSMSEKAAIDSIQLPSSEIMNLSSKKRSHKELSIFIVFIIFFVILMVQQLTILPVKAISNSFTETFDTTTNMDAGQTTTDGWGLGNISCKHKEPTYDKYRNDLKYA